VQGLLRDERIDAASTYMSLDTSGPVEGYVGEFIIPLAQIAAPGITAIVGAWLHARFGRKVRIEFYADGNVKRAEAQTPEQVISLIKAARHEAQPRPKRQPK
jgi:hypothetical protein